MLFLYGFGAGLFTGGTLAYLYAKRVIAEYKALSSAAKDYAAKTFDSPPHH